VDNNCDGNADEGLTFITYYTDADGDGFGDANDPGVSLCANPNDGRVTNNFDCDDSDENINPDATEVCDGLDNNCDGNADEGLTFIMYYADADGDGFGDANAPGVSLCADPNDGSVTNNGDCDDSDDTINPDAPEVCDGIDNNCNGLTDNEESSDPPICQAANDEPEDAIAINCDQVVTGETTDATESLAPINCDGETSNSANDVWYSFIADGNTVYNLTNNLAFPNDMVFEVLSAGDLVNFGCVTTFSGPADLGVLPAGNYLVRVYEQTFFGGSASLDFSFTLTCGEPAISGIDGSVPNWNNSCAERGVTVELYQPGSAILEASYQTILASDGTFSVQDIATGTFDVFVKIEGYLRDGFAGLVIGDEAIDLEIPNPRLGDLNEDNVVNFFDGSTFNLFITPLPYDPVPDYNCDGSVNFFDVSALNTTFNQTGDNPPLSQP
jgi:hypothetical protein